MPGLDFSSPLVSKNTPVGPFEAPGPQVHYLKGIYKYYLIDIFVLSYYNIRKTTIFANNYNIFNQFKNVYAVRAGAVADILIPY